MTTLEPIVGVPVAIELRSPDGKQTITLCKAVTDRDRHDRSAAALARLERRRL